MLQALNSLNLSKKAALTSTLMFVLSFLSLGILLTFALESSLAKLLTTQQQTTVNFIAANLEQKILLRAEALKDVAKALPPEAVKDREAARRYLQSRLAIFRLFANGVVIIDAQGRGVADHPPAPGRATGDYSELEYFQQAKATGQMAIGKPRVGRFTQKTGVAIAVPILSVDGALLGVMAGYISLSDKSIFDQESAKLGKSGEFLLVSVPYSLIMTDSDGDHTMNVIDEEKNSFLYRVVHDRAATTTVGEDMHGAKALVSDAQLLSGQWNLIALMPVEEAFEPIRRVTSQALWTSGVVLLGLGAVMGLIMHLLMRPLTRTTQAFQEMAQGHRPVQALRVNRDDELGRMLHAFNGLQEQLSEKDLALRASNLRYANLFEHMTTGFALHELVYDHHGKAVDFVYLDVNPTYERMLGRTREQLVGQRGTVVLPRVEAGWLEAFADAVQNGQSRTFEDYYREKDLWYRAMVYCPEPGKFVVMLDDVTELRSAQQELRRMAYHDALTGLPNRMLFADRLQVALAQAQRRSTQLAVGYLDLDRFKQVNDTLGHAVGDLLLKEVAERLRASLRAEDTVSRLGGDEFALLLNSVMGLPELRQVLQRILASVAAPYDLAGHRVTISTSIGVTVFPQDKADADTLLRHADEALYAAKAAGRNGYQIFGET